MKQSGKKNVCRLQPCAPADRSSARVCWDCLETLRYLNENQYSVCQAFTTRNKHRETHANHTSSLCLSRGRDPRGILIARTNHRRVKFITTNDILLFLAILLGPGERFTCEVGARCREGPVQGRRAPHLSVIGEGTWKPQTRRPPLSAGWERPHQLARGGRASPRSPASAPPTWTACPQPLAPGSPLRFAF